MIDNEFLANSIKELLDGIDSDDSVTGWWETSTGAGVGGLKLGKLLELVASSFGAVTAESDSMRQQLDALELSRRSWMDEAKSLEVRVDALKSLLLESSELFYSIEGELSALSAQEVDAMRGKVFSAIKNKNESEALCRGDIRIGTACGHCSRCERASAIESLAKTIYETWVTCAGYVPWAEGGNSAKQDEARQIASRTFELALANQVDPSQ